MPRGVKHLARDDALDDAFRPTGISVLGDVPWGTHLCLFHETKCDFLALMAAFFSAGLQNQEFCLGVLPDYVSEEEALSAFRQAMPDFDRHLSRGNIELIPRDRWIGTAGKVDIAGVMERYREKLREALSKGYAGLRAMANGSEWLLRNEPRKFSEFETTLDDHIADKKILLACSFQLQECNATDLLDATCTHQVAAALRSGLWEIVELYDVRPRGAGELDPAFSRTVERLSPRERAVLAEIVAGASSKKAAQRLGISPRTVDFHRANIMRKLGAKNAAELVRMALVR